MSVPKIIFIVPYRNRENDKNIFQDHIKYLMSDYLSTDYLVYYSHQNDNRAFNRGAVKNIGFLAMRNKYPNDYKNITFVFNDIDIVPTHKNFLNYITDIGIIKHFYGFKFALGGIFSITGHDFELISGFPNFWGWGFEDNLIYLKCKDKGITVDRSVFYPIYDHNFIQTNNTGKKVLNNIKPNLQDDNIKNNNNILTIKNLNYSIDGDMININNFDTIENYSQLKFYEQDLQLNRKILDNKELNYSRKDHFKLRLKNFNISHEYNSNILDSSKFQIQSKILDNKELNYSRKDHFKIRLKNFNISHEYNSNILDSSKFQIQSKILDNKELNYSRKDHFKIRLNIF